MLGRRILANAQPGLSWPRLALLDCCQVLAATFSAATGSKLAKSGFRLVALLCRTLPHSQIPYTDNHTFTNPYGNVRNTSMTVG